MTRRKHEVTAESFLRNITDFELKVVHEHGVHRHLQGRNKNGSNIFYFDVVTWPGYLTIAGDMGSYTFWRTNDMLSFFRRSDLAIDAVYWTKKLVSVCRTDGLEKFSLQNVKDSCRSHLRDLELTRSELRQTLTFLRDTVWHASSSHEVFEALNDFEVDGRPMFEYAWDWCTTETLSDRTVWNMFAIVWAVQQYDAIKSAASGS